MRKLLRIVGMGFDLILLFAPPGAFLTDTGLGLAHGWRPGGDLEWAVMAGAALWVILGGAVLAWSRSRQFLGMHRFEFFFLFIMLAGGWLVLEWAAEVLNTRLTPAAAFHTRGPNLHRIVYPEPDAVYGIVEPAHFRTDARGIRAPEPPEDRQTLRLLCVGGSTTECTYLDDTETWPALTARLLSERNGAEDAWAGNAGISGFDTAEHLAFIKDSPLLKGIDCVIVQPGINDLWRFLAGEEDRIRYDRFAQASAPATGRPAEEALLPPYWTRSKVISLYHTTRRLREQSAALDPAAAEGIGGGEYRIRRQRRAEASLTDTLPDLTAGLSGYESRIRATIATAHDRRVEIRFTTQPVLWAEGLPEDVQARCWFGWLPDGKYLTLAALRRAMDAYNETLLRVCAETNVPCVDLGALSGNPEYFYDDCHFTEAGARAVAEHIAAAW